MSHRWSSVMLASVLAVGLVPGTTTPVRAVPVDQSYPVPASGTFTLRGHGYGHGHGMSQYGAYGAARRGLSYGRIVRFYYPGTSWGTARRWYRVLLTADTTSDVVVSRAPGLRVRDLGSGRLYRLPAVPGATRWRLDVEGGRTVVGYRTTRWHRYRPGGRAALVGDGQLNAHGPLRLWTPTGSRTYRGVLRSVRPSPGSAARDTVNVVAPDAYVRGVVPAEMPTSWNLAAVRAQAVAARTYASWSRGENPGRYWHICDTTACQVYGGVAAETRRGNEAVRSTAGRILTYGGAAAFTQFSASSGGRLSAGSRPYLVAKTDPYDDHSANPVHDWTVRLSARRIQRAYPGIGRLARLHVTRREGAGQWRGRVVRIVLDGRRRNVTLSGDRFRSAFGLRSTWFRA
jgi:stage II sporulation protein D